MWPCAVLRGEEPFRAAKRACVAPRVPAPYDSPATGAGSPTTDDMHSAGTPRAAPPVLLLSTPAARTLLSPRRSESPRHATRSRQPARPCLAPAARPRIATPAFPARPRIAPSRRPPAHRALNCVIAAHRRRRSPPPLAAAPLWRLRPGSPPPARPPPLRLLTTYFMSAAVPGYLVKPIIV